MRQTCLNSRGEGECRWLKDAAIVKGTRIEIG